MKHSSGMLPIFRPTQLYTNTFLSFLWLMYSLLSYCVKRNPTFSSEISITKTYQ